ncbi:type IV pilin protein [Alishewanella jeotgali]|uniref:TppA protein n=1 Tax=Alishewanella jeotgali KCTC 22429 TaxID=1129374 RepID=H3ZCE6_9ALTE|nr:type IV pilin protein [Alishewanella jeotgali]EHR41738.1 TppA protein [Alishewanella jeotgali KCTC 22429]
MFTRGFSLLEMLVVLAILGILIQLSYPSYQQFVLRSYRAEAVTTLLELANRQEQRLLDTGRYSDQLADLGVSSADTSSGRYRIQLVIDSDGTAFQIILTAQGAQQHDSACQQFSINHLGQRNHGVSAALSCWD